MAGPEKLAPETLEPVVLETGDTELELTALETGAGTGDGVAVDAAGTGGTAEAIGGTVCCCDCPATIFVEDGIITAIFVGITLAGAGG